MRGALLFLAFVATPALAAEVAGIKVDEHVKLESVELVLNGAGLRTKAFFKVYVAGLYLAERKANRRCLRCLAQSAFPCARCAI
jgi:long-chain acyl-CoA synthetase